MLSQRMLRADRVNRRRFSALGAAVVIASQLVVGVTVSHSQSFPALRPITAAEVQKRVAVGGGASTSVKFINNYGSPISISWIDYSGHVKPYATLAPNGSYVQPTYENHAWLITDKVTGKALQGFVATAQPAEAVIGALAQSASDAKATVVRGVIANNRPVIAVSADAVPIAQSIDALFSQWSADWMFDRYVTQSSRVTEMQSKDGLYAVRGDFKFLRSGASATIPFAASLRKQGGAFVPINLCYNDTTSGMTDCTNSATGPGTRQVMRTIVLAGVLAALSDEGSSEAPTAAELNKRNWDAQEMQQRQEEQDRGERQIAAEARQENAEFWERMNAPNEY